MSFLTTRLEPTHTVTPQRDQAIEGLRGGAALAVLYAHLFSPVVKVDGGGALDPAYAPPDFFHWIEGGSLAVLVFFLLSGYVIGLSMSGPFTASEIPAYFRRRAIRILPIYVTAIGLGLAFSPGIPLGDALGHLFFLQNSGSTAITRLLPANPSLWSLPYEAAFYLVFPLLWFSRPRILPLLVTCGALCALATLRPSALDFPAAIVGGAAFWLVGLACAWRLAPAVTEDGPWPSLLLIALATWKLDPLGSLVHRLGFDAVAWHVGFKFQHLAVLPVLTWLFLIVAKRAIPRGLNLEVITWGIPVLFIGWRFFRGTLASELTIPAVLLGLAVVLRAWSPGLRFWRRLAGVGAISYGIYAIGYPVQCYVRTLLPDYSGHFVFWLARLLLALALTFALAWWLECKVQPRVRRFFA